MKKLSSLSVFLPTYNEEQNIAHVIEQIHAFLPKVASTFEILVINDGSTDRTKKIVTELQKNISSLKLISHGENRGYGSALKTGFKNSQHEWIFFTDSDNQFDIHELSLFVPFTKEYSVIIGHRKKRAEGPRRALFAYCFKLFIDVLFRLHVKDIDCAFKLLKRSAIIDLKLQSNGAFTTTEFLYLLKKKGLPFKQIPVTHFDRKFGNPSGNNVKVIIKAFQEAFKVFYLTHFK